MYCFSKCCRLCLTKDNTLVNINWTGSDGIPFLDKLGLLAPSLVANPRDYMNSICEQCRKRLKTAYRFIQNCFKSDIVLEQYCMQLINADTAQNRCTASEVSEIQLIENMVKKESIPISVKEECLEDLHVTTLKEEHLEDLPAIDDNQYYLKSAINLDENDLSPVDFKIKLELKEEASLNVDDTSTLNEEIIVSEYDRDQPGNVQQIDPLAETSIENYISSSSDVPNDVNNQADNLTMISSNLLTKNQRIKSKKLPNKRCFKCGICDKTYSQSRSLKLHENIHSGEQLFKCKICSKQFVHSRSLINHERVHSGERPYQCKICDKKFGHPSDLSRHEKIHSGERPYKCNTCNMSFTQSGNLKNHERIHTGERPFKCKLCSKTFVQSGHLKEHERFHTAEHPYKCKICKKTFTQSCDLKRHERLHSGECPYKCETCNMKFTQSKSLKVHERIHTGERFKCKICYKQFADSGNRNKHERIHSGDHAI